MQSVIAMLVLFALGGPAFWAQEGCVRGEPEAVFSATSKQVVSHTFKRVNPHEALEEIALASGAKVQIRHWGCEYFVMTLTVLPAVPAVSSAPGKGRLREAAQWLRDLSALGGKWVFDLDRAAAALESGAERNPTATSCEETPVAGDGTAFLQTRVSLAPPDPESPGSLSITLSKGPL